MNTYQSWAEKRITAAEKRITATEHSPPTARVPLSTNQHILHLLLTVFTFGLWAPVWFILAIRGNVSR
jgi:hypothetical protein